MALTRFSWWALMCMAAVPAGGGAASAFTLASTAFSQGGAIPSRYTCEGDNVSPPLRWTGVPAQARTLVLIVDETHAYDAYVSVEIAAATSGRHRTVAVTSTSTAAVVPARRRRPRLPGTAEPRVASKSSLMVGTSKAARTA